jgi:putative sterol carrier protein
MPLTISAIMAKIPTAFKPDPAAAIDAVVHIKLTGAEAGEWNAIVRYGKCAVAQGIPRSKPTITIAADSGDFIQTVEGQLDPVKAVMEGMIRVTGDPALGMKLLGMFKMP